MSGEVLGEGGWGSGGLGRGWGGGGGGGGHCLFEGGYPTAKLPPLLFGAVCPSVFFLPPPIHEVHRTPPPKIKHSQ